MGKGRGTTAPASKGTVAQSFSDLFMLRRWLAVFAGRCYACVMIRLSERDYGGAGLSVRRAFVEARDAFGGQLSNPMTKPISILWNGRDIIIGDILDVPQRGRFHIDFVSCRPTTLHGVDIEIPGGGIVFKGGKISPTLRTWFGSWYEPELEWVEYPYHAPKGQLRVTTASERTHGDQKVVERWTGNAAMFVERLGAHKHVYHCSHADSSPPNFEDMVIALTLRVPE